MTKKDQWHFHQAKITNGVDVN